METAITDGGISSRHWKEHYNDRGAFYKGVYDLEGKNFFQRRPAPKEEESEYVWFPTDICERFLTEIPHTTDE